MGPTGPDGTRGGKSATDERGGGEAGPLGNGKPQGPSSPPEGMSRGPMATAEKSRSRLHEATSDPAVAAAGDEAAAEAAGEGDGRPPSSPSGALPRTTRSGDATANLPDLRRRREIRIQPSTDEDAATDRPRPPGANLRGRGAAEGTTTPPAQGTGGPQGEGTDDRESSSSDARAQKRDPSTGSGEDRGENPTRGEPGEGRERAPASGEGDDRAPASGSGRGAGRLGQGGEEGEEEAREEGGRGSIGQFFFERPRWSLNLQHAWRAFP